MVKDGIFLGKRYEVISKIGAGGMADVYKGKDHKLNRYVAIKVLKKEFKEDEVFVRKFRSEAQAAAGLLHPNIVNVYDVGEDRGLYYMVMELVEGITLKEYIEKKKRLSPKEVISIAIQMCNGIEAAHNHHIVHRDIKPQNIIISRDGKVKVTDFGIARMASSNTINTAAMGSVHYTSPEQARGGYVDAKSDIYSLGITMYEMATGQVPFNGNSTVEVAIKHLQEEITPPSRLVPKIPRSLEQIILKCTQKSSERRYENVGELIQDLKHALVDPQGDFVVIEPQQNGGTIIITEDELDNIRDTYGDDDDSGDYDDEDDDGYEDDDDEDPDEGDVNSGMSKVIKIFTIVAAIIVLLVLALVVGRVAGIFQTSQKVVQDQDEDEEEAKVPSVTGKTKEEAIELLKERGLGYKIAAEEESEKYEAGYVIRQGTEAGTKVKKHTQIELVISSRLVEEEIAVPDVFGMDENKAQRELERAGFRNVVSEAVYSEYEQGTVLGTSPTARTKVSKDTQIKMRVSKGEQKISVPNVKGRTENDAKSVIKNAGLVMGSVTTDYSDSVAEGLVISQTPDSGQKVSPDTSVSIVVSLGKKVEQNIPVPNVIGASESSARKMLTDAGLAPDVTIDYSDSVPAGCVISCNPGVGSSVAPGSRVTLVVSIGPEQSGEPDAGTQTGE